MKFSGKMCLKTKLKVRKNQGFSLTLEDKYAFRKTIGGKQTVPPPPAPTPVVLGLIVKEWDQNFVGTETCYNLIRIHNLY